MKSDLKAKFLQHFVAKKKDGGFTLIELLVVIIIIGILSAIALPSFLNQANKAKQSEAKQYTGTLVRSVQATYLADPEFFANDKAKAKEDLGKLGAPIASQTENYIYYLAEAKNEKDPAISSVIVHGESRKETLKPYVGKVVKGKVSLTSEATAIGILCENVAPKAGVADDKPADPAAVGEAPTCGKDPEEGGKLKRLDKGGI